MRDHGLRSRDENSMFSSCGPPLTVCPWAQSNHVLTYYVIFLSVTCEEDAGREDRTMRAASSRGLEYGLAQAT